MNTNLVGMAAAMLACLTATAQQPLDAPQKNAAASAAPAEAPSEDQPSPAQALRAAMAAADRLQDAAGDEAHRLHRTRNGNPDYHCRRAAPPLPSSPTRGEEAHRATVIAGRRRAFRHHQDRLSG